MAKNTSQTQITRALVGFDSGSIGPFELCNAGEYRGNYGPPEAWQETKMAMIKIPHFGYSHLQWSSNGAFYIAMLVYQRGDVWRFDFFFKMVGGSDLN